MDSFRNFFFYIFGKNKCMVHFDELRISSDKQTILIQCHIKDFDAYKNMYIKSIKIEYYKKRGLAGVPGNNAVTLYQNTTDDKDVRAVQAMLSVGALNEAVFGTGTFRGGLFYVTVTCDGTLAPSIALLDCGADNTVTVGLVLDWELVYMMGMQFVKAGFSPCSDCDIPDNFEHFLLAWNSLKLAMDSCDYDTVDKIWDRYMNPKKHISIPGCGCKK